MTGGKEPSVNVLFTMILASNSMWMTIHATPFPLWSQSNKDGEID